MVVVVGVELVDGMLSEARRSQPASAATAAAASDSASVRVYEIRFI